MMSGSNAVDLIERIDGLERENEELRKSILEARRNGSVPAHPDPTGKTREPPHCPTCNCGSVPK